ncbi:MAG: HAMP domain-containing histidine kinase [Deltaproteobacteria bacterium]|nr:HAMP domain-containing histidine kinase [Deltaproteobacteria bacterium]MBW2696707.1 HAMP domain-containing histidine kinase [Deltaproteobacteria bacterium]
MAQTHAGIALAIAGSPEARPRVVHGAGRPVEVNAERRAGRLHIRVRDHGAGINATNRDRIFDRFFTTERDHGGTGLGLPIARAVAERRGGWLDLESSPGGTCFELVV